MNKKDLEKKLNEQLDDILAIDEKSLFETEEWLEWANDQKEKDMVLGLSGVEPELLELWVEDTDDDA